MVYECPYCSKKFKQKTEFICHLEPCDKDKPQIITPSSDSQSKIIIESNDADIDSPIQYYIFKLNSYGDEDTSYINNDWLKDVMKKGTQSIELLIDKIFFNEEHPENHCINIQGGGIFDVGIYDGESWQITSKSDIIDSVYDKYVTFLWSKFNELKHDMNTIDQEKIKEYIGNFMNKQVETVTKKEIGKLFFRRRRIAKKTIAGMIGIGLVAKLEKEKVIKKILHKKLFKRLK